MLNLVVVSDFFHSLSKERVMYYSFGIGLAIGSVAIAIFGFQNLLLLGAMALIVNWAIKKRKNE